MKLCHTKSNRFGEKKKVAFVLGALWMMGSSPLRAGSPVVDKSAELLNRLEAPSESTPTPLKNQRQPLLTGRWGEELYPSQLVYDYPATTQTIKGKTVQIPAKRVNFLVVVSMGSTCPIVKRSVSVLNQMVQEYGPRGVELVGLFPQNFDNVNTIGDFALRTGAVFPVYLDDLSASTEDKEPSSWSKTELGMRVTPEVVIFDVRQGYGKRKMIYRGLIDDAAGLSTHRKKARVNYIRRALDAAFEKPFSSSTDFDSTAAQGCLISDRIPLKEDTQVEYYPTIAKIVQDKCQRCHRPGELGADAFMAFNDYDDFSSAGSTAISRILSRTMPPWQARIPKEGKPLVHSFVNDARLSEEEIKTLKAWYDSGMVEGDPSQAPLPIDWPKEGEWRIGKPDFVFQMPEPFIVPTERWDGYKYYYIRTGFTEDKYVRAVELRPGNRSVVHHMGGILGPCPDKDLQGVEAMQYFYGIAGDQIKKLGDWVPGDDFNARTYPPNVGLRIPAHSCIVLEMHYTPTGEAEEPDVSELALILHEKKPEIVVKSRVENNKKLRIDPYDGHSEVSDKYWFDTDVHIQALAPHMHYRGKDYVLYHVQNPGTALEKKTRVLEVPAYDFRWQRTYEFKKPLQLRAGDYLEAVGHFDNSHYNPNNPDPSVMLFFGLKSEEEMFNTRFKYIEKKVDRYDESF